MTADEDYELFENSFHDWLEEHGCEVRVVSGREAKLVCLDMDLNKLKAGIAALIMNTP